MKQCAKMNQVAPIKGSAGWAGVSLNVAMVGHLLVVAWPNGQSVLGSLRLATYVFLSSTLFQAALLTTEMQRLLYTSSVFGKGNPLSHCLWHLCERDSSLVYVLVQRLLPGE